MVTNNLGQPNQFTTTMQSSKFATNTVNANSTQLNITHQIITHPITNSTLSILKPNLPGQISEIPTQVLSAQRLNEIVRDIDPTLHFDEDVEDLMLKLIDEFLEHLITGTCLMAKHRHVSSPDIKDVQLYLEKSYHIWIPGFGTDEVKAYKRATITEAHKQRLALIRRSLKKY